jgi:hypothetical protein
MSRLAVRTEINRRLQQWAIINGIPFYETLNEKGKIKDRLWSTVEYFADYTENLCMGSTKKKETGTIDVLVFQQSGSGDSAGVHLCDTIQDFFDTLIMTDLGITDTTAANDFAGGDGSGLVSGWVVSMAYEYFY